MSSKKPDAHRVQLTFTRNGDGELYQYVDELFSQIGKRDRARRLKAMLVKGIVSPLRNAVFEPDVLPKKHVLASSKRDSITSGGHNESHGGAQAQLVGIRVNFDNFGS